MDVDINSCILCPGVLCLMDGFVRDARLDSEIAAFELQGHSQFVQDK